jgi:hypothetical protein
LWLPRSLDTATCPRHRHLPSTRRPALDTTTCPRHSHLPSTRNLARFDSNPTHSKGARRQWNQKYRLAAQLTRCPAVRPRLRCRPQCAQSKRHLAPSLACREAPVHQQPRATMRTQAMPPTRDTLFVVAPRDYFGTCDEASTGTASFDHLTAGTAAWIG